MTYLRKLDIEKTSEEIEEVGNCLNSAIEKEFLMVLWSQSDYEYWYQIMTIGISTV
jgi:hypothetical protein